MTAISLSKPSLAHRILDSFPSGSYALGTLLRLVDIVETEAVDTAAVECQIQPRMLINPQFVEQKAATSERLLMLVMHELHHVLLGHTRLLPRVTEVDNLVFDAVINAMLCRMFPETEHTSLFTDLYSDRKFPECLLRPPIGFASWKRIAVPPALKDQKRRELANVYCALYSTKGATYEELYDLFRKHVSEGQAEGVQLIGDHGKRDGSASGNLESRSPLLFEAVRAIVEHWPQPPNPIRGRSLSSLVNEGTLRLIRRPNNRRSLRNLLRRVGGVHGSGRTARAWRTEPASVQVPLPTRDRRSTVLRALGSRPLLYGSEVPAPRLLKAGKKVHVYLDVSGSIGDLKGALYAAVLDCRQFVHPKVHLFSTEIADISLADLRAGRCISTGGTDIQCVAEHIRTNTVRRAIVITDGYVGRPAGCAAQTLAKVKLGIALTPDIGTRSDFENFADYWIQLHP